MQQSSFDLRDFLSGALSRSKTNGAEQPRKADICEGCCTKFPFYKRKKQCGECHLTYCGNCLSSPNSVTSTASTSVLSRIIDKNQQFCRKCHILLARPLCRADLQKLRVKDLQHYLTTHHVSFKGCVEKEDLVNLLIRYVGSTGSYNDVRQTSSGTTSFNPRATERDDSGVFYSNTRRSSVPNLPSPTDAPSLPSHYSSHGPNTDNNLRQSPTCLNNSEALNQASSSPTTEVHTPNSANVSEIRPNTNPTVIRNDDPMSVEELTDWEMLDRVDLNTGTDPIVSEMDDESTDEPVASEVQSSVHINELIDEHIEVTTTDDHNDGSFSHTPASQDSPSLSVKALVLSSIKTIDDLEQLSIKQLKELLMRNRVDFRGCVEKAELVERVKRLWMESVQAKKDLDNLSMDELCKICMDAPVECVMLECGHMATCTTCGKQLNECPICRQYVVRIVRIFKA